VLIPDLQPSIDRAVELLQRPFWTHFDFWIALSIGVGGLVFSILAFLEARSAKRAAILAGRTVKLQTIAIELSEIAQKLDRIEPEIRFNEARDLLAEISRRVHRATSPFMKDPKLSSAVTDAREALKTAQNSLKAVRPADPTKEDEAPLAVYNAVENNFAAINDCVADLLGLLEKEAYDSGDGDVRS
jgi:hypothetical protein